MVVRLPLELVRIGPHDGARTEVSVQRRHADGAVSSIELDLFLLVADRFVYVFTGRWPAGRRRAMRPVLDTVVSTFMHRTPTENQTLRDQVLGCWHRHPPALAAAGPRRSSSSGTLRLDGQLGQYVHDVPPEDTDGGPASSRLVWGAGSFWVVHRQLIFHSNHGDSHVMTLQRQGQGLKLNGERWQRCEPATHNDLR